MFKAEKLSYLISLNLHDLYKITRVYGTVTLAEQNKTTNTGPLNLTSLFSVITAAPDSSSYIIIHRTRSTRNHKIREANTSHDCY